MSDDTRSRSASPEPQPQQQSRRSRQQQPQQPQQPQQQSRSSDALAQQMPQAGELLGNTLGQVTGGGGREEGLDLNLEVDVQIRARVHGDVTLSLL
ncbi:hypothetical protein FB45DRAFT_928458 [Roridomyces roridus]|uniref:Uncharacterized protein n=1 Tax=Roridomyces roridus TaxID=1738132 RepID=A0AAD7BHK1_9AGAR|nr:hypothetical protein FB45DRAFT_928458 [Roridomyces roridus]